jgi:preprotein translocase subunit YajC
MFVSPAFAQTGTEAMGPGALEAFLPIILIFVVFYFLLIRPQQKKMRQHKEMLAAIRRGDRIVTGGGIIGTVSKIVDDQEIVVEIADGVRVRVQRGLVSGVIAKTEAGSGEAGKGTGTPASGEPEKAGRTVEAGTTESAPSGLKRLFGGKKS